MGRKLIRTKAAKLKHSSKPRKRFLLSKSFVSNTPPRRDSSTRLHVCCEWHTKWQTAVQSALEPSCFPEQTEKHASSEHVVITSHLPIIYRLPSNNAAHDNSPGVIRPPGRCSADELPLTARPGQNRTRARECGLAIQDGQTVNN